MRRAAKRDSAEPGIVEALVGVGCTVVKLNDPDVADLLVYYRDTLHLLEVKTGNAQQSEGQKKFAETVPVKVVRTPADALAAINFTWQRGRR